MTEEMCYGARNLKHNDSIIYVGNNDELYEKSAIFLNYYVDKHEIIDKNYAIIKVEEHEYVVATDNLEKKDNFLDYWFM